MASTLQAGVACWPAPTQAVTPGRALFAKGLAKGCTTLHLQSIFSSYGTVTDCQIARHRSGRSAGFAIVTFLHPEEAQAAMEAMDNCHYMGRKLSVKWFSPERALEGSSHSVDALNMQTLQHALQLSALQPVDLMAQLAQMLDSPRILPQQHQNPHVAAWLDNFMLTQQQQRDSPLTPQLHDPTQQPSQLDLLNLSALSLTDLPATGLGMASVPGFSTLPATPSSLDVPDGAVFVTATANSAGNKAAPGSTGGHGLPSSQGSAGSHPHTAATAAAIIAGNTAGGNLVLEHSRLAKWCTAPGPSSAGGRSSAAQSLTDDASSDETASVHASDDSSIATTTLQTLAHTSCDAPSCCTEGSSPAVAGQHQVLAEAGAAATVPAPPPGTPASATCGGAAAAVFLAPQTPICMPTDGDDALLRSRAYTAAAAAAVANSRPGVIGSDPGNLQQQQQQQALGRQVGVVAGYGGAAGAVLPGVPPLPPLRTVATAPPAGPHAHAHAHLHHHPHAHAHAHAHAHLTRVAMPQQGRASAPVFNSCGGGSTAAVDACVQQAVRLQQALAERVRTMNAQQQYVDALAKLAAAREQFMAAASLLNSSNNGGLAVPPSLAAAPAAHPHMAAPPPSPAAAAGPMGSYMAQMAAGANAAGNPYLAGPPPTAPGAVPDLNTLLMLQNAASMNRPLY